MSARRHASATASTAPSSATCSTTASAVAFGVAFPAVFFLLATVGAFELDTAFRLAKWSGLGLIGFYGFCAGRLAGSSVRRSLFQAVAVAAIGGAVIAFKAIVH